MRILIIEDNADVAEHIGDFLELEGHSIDFAPDGVVGLHFAVTQSYDAIVLDLMLPGIDGLSLCRRLRLESDSTTPILMLTALQSLDDKLAGFESGADDYLTKPFALKELAARLRALHTRSVQRGRNLRFGEVEMDVKRMLVRREGRRLHLGQITFRILERLLRAAPGVVSRADLEQMLWGEDPPLSDSLRTHIYGLRQALDRPFDRALLETVHGIGYRLRDDDDPTND
ncbi:MAG: response regulator transcription factor [Thermoanaerobaculia bacterium]|nr:response regulator transcription factor [Thermoanaerobaculia bacterium]